MSPFNFFRQNLVFEVSKNMTLAQVAKEIMGKTHVFVKYPADEALDTSTTIGEVAAKVSDQLIIDLVVKKE